MVAIRGGTFKKPWRRSCHSSKLKSSSAPIGREDSWCFHAAGSSNAPLLGSTAAEGLPRIGRTSIATCCRSCGLPQSASCSENFVIPPDVFGQTLRQPLGALTMRCEAAQLYLDRTPPDVENVRSCLDSMLSDGQRASQIFANFLHLFRKSDEQQELINVNEVAVEALRVLHEQLDAHVVLTRTELTSEMLQVRGHRGQLIEVIINLVQNAVEAMDAVEKNRRVLQLRTECRADAIIVAVEDSGPGIDPEKSDNIFDAFVTTKSNGTGLGLAICRMIVERHEGKLSVSPAQPHGCIFQIVLP